MQREDNQTTRTLSHADIQRSKVKDTRQYEIKDSGERKTFESGMVRDTATGKTEYDRVLDGPMFDRWAEHLTKATAKYPDLPDGRPNWTLASGDAEKQRFQKSAFRHFRAWLRGDTDEDHAAAIFFNVNGYEYVDLEQRKARVLGDIRTLADLPDGSIIRVDPHFFDPPGRNPEIP